MTTPAQRQRRAVRDLEETATNLLYFVETYNVDAANAQGYHQAKRRDLFEKARQYAAAVRRLARLRA